MAGPELCVVLGDGRKPRLRARAPAPVRSRHSAGVTTVTNSVDPRYVPLPEQRAERRHFIHMVYRGVNSVYILGLSSQGSY